MKELGLVRITHNPVRPDPLLDVYTLKTNLTNTLYFLRSFFILDHFFINKIGLFLYILI